jgi:uncharacterized protein
MARLTGLLCAAFALLAALAAPACSRAPAPVAAEGPALWRLADADSEIWLFGAVHLLPPELKWRTPRIDAALNAADTLMLETPIDAAGQAEIATLAQRLGANPPGVTLSSQLKPTDQGDLARVCAMVRVNLAALEGVRPWMAAVSLSVADVIAKGFNPDAGVERVLDAQARRDGKARVYFETAEEQIRFFADLPQATQVELLRSTLKEIETKDDDLDVINNAWAHGDVKALAKYFAKSERDTAPEVYAALIHDRNARWADKIDAMLQGKGKVFIAVGAAHLIGPGSVIDLLRKRGYAVEGP